MNFKKLFDNILTEEKDIGNMYIKRVLNSQTRNFLEKFTKLTILLPKEINEQDKNHWEGEMISCMMLTIPQYGGGLTADEIKEVFERNFKEDFALNKEKLFPKYNSLMDIYEYNSMYKEIEKKYSFFIKAVSNLFLSIYKIKGNKKEQILQQKQMITEFVKNYEF